MGFRITDIRTDDFRDIAKFLHAEIALSDDIGSGLKDSAAQFRDLSERLTCNPFRLPELPDGYCVRNDADLIVGALLIFPWRFVWGDRKLIGLVSGKFFVNDAARMQGFLLFRKYLAIKDADFWLATTCNALSSQLWARSMALPLTYSDREYTLPINFGPLIEELVLRKIGSTRIAAAARKMANVFNVFRSHSGVDLVDVSACEDWELLANIAEENRMPDMLECDRTVEYLAWTYARFRANAYRLRTSRGDQGWFILAAKRRGKMGQISAVEIVDWSLPKSLPLLDLIKVAAKIVRENKGDLLFLKGRCGLAERELKGHMMERRLNNASAYVIGNTLETSRLASRIVVATPDRF